MAIDISSTTRRIVYTGSAGTGPYAFNFEVLAQTDIDVYFNDTELTLTTDYTVSDITVDGTGEVTIVTGTNVPTTPDADDRITIVGARTIERATDFTTGGPLFAATLNDEFDSLTIFAQQNKEEADRSIKAPVTDPDTVDMTLPKNDDRKGKYLSFNSSTGDPEVVNTVTDVTTVAGIADDVTTVSGISSDVTTVADNDTDVSTVATNISSVTTVATNINDVITVANDLNEAISEIETAADDLNEAVSEIDTVSSSISNVDAVGTNIANVNTVAGIDSDVTTVAGISANVTTVAGVSANVTTVAGISSDVTTVAADGTDIGTVAGISSDVTTVAPIASDVTTVAGISADVSAVEDISANVTTVAGVASNVTTVAGISSDVTSVGTIASDVTTVAGVSSDVTTAANNITDISNFADVYYGPSATAPSTRSDGSALQIGDLYFDTTNAVMKVYGSGGWADAGSTVNGTSDRFTYSVSTSTTTITGADDNANTLAYDAGYIDVYLNGVKMVNGADVTVTSGTSVVFATAIGTSGTDTVDIITYGTFELSNFSVGDANDVSLGGVATSDLLQYSGSAFVPKSFDEVTPDQTGQSGKYLTTDGTNSSWGTIDTDPTMGGDLSGTASNASLGADVVDGTNIADDAIDSEHIADGAIDGVHLAADIVDGTKIADDSIDSEHIAADAIDAEHYAANSVDATALNVSGNGTSGQLLSSDGDGSMTWVAAAGGGFANMDVFTGPGTWTNPGNVEKVKVTVTGGGGGGGGGNPNYPQTQGGGAGAGGGTAIEVISIPTSTNVPVTVGGGGTGTTENTVNAPGGGTSSFGSYCSATGGAGGYRADASQNSTTGGIGSGGQINLRGGSGYAWNTYSPGQNAGGSIWGEGGKCPRSRNLNVGKGGDTYGTGGAGTAGRPQTGGNGGSGIVVVEY
jgi:tetrahydromethanopterin S-methyltransferase subunit B